MHKCALIQEFGFNHVRFHFEVYRVVFNLRNRFVEIPPCHLVTRNANERVLSDWILVTAELTPFVLGLAVAYWGDRIHRASWMGALILLQSVSYLILMIPHLTHRARVIEETPNVTHMSLYAGQWRGGEG